MPRRTVTGLSQCWQMSAMGQTRTLVTTPFHVCFAPESGHLSVCAVRQATKRRAPTTQKKGRLAEAVEPALLVDQAVALRLRAMQSLLAALRPVSHCRRTLESSAPGSFLGPEPDPQ